MPFLYMTGGTGCRKSSLAAFLLLLRLPTAQFDLRFPATAAAVIAADLRVIFAN